MNTKMIGDKGEIMAKNYLKKNNYKVIDTNYRNKIGEIDIIAMHKNTLIFVEVKYRNNLTFGYPRESVNGYKQNKIIKTAQLYLVTNNYKDIPIRFDVIEILGDSITHIENAF